MSASGELRISAVELPARYGDARAALEEVASLVARAPKPDLVLLPEASLTGYVSPSGDFDLTRFAEPFEGPTLATVSKLARELGCAFAAPLVEREGDACFNAFFVVDREGEVIARYRKRHPWIPETWATSGGSPYAEFALGGVRFLLAICFDIHFLEEEAADALERADVLLFPSAWVDDSPTDSRGPLLEDLASHHEVTIVNANWGHGAPRVPGQGGTRIVTPSGTRWMASGEARVDLTFGG